MAPTESKPRLLPTTLTHLLQDDIVPIKTLVERHGAAATIAKMLLGVVPNTGKYYEIWPPANKMYYVMVPTFLNLPAYVFGFGAPKDLVSLALYTSSLAAECPYCSSHTCTFALRRGTDAKKLRVETIAARHGESSEVFTPVERSVIDVAENLARFPCKLTNAHRRALQDNIKDPATTEAIVLGAAMMGYLNKGMDALGMPLEVETYRETRSILGDAWTPGLSGQLVDPNVHTPEEVPSTDGFLTYMGVVWNGPSAASFERRALEGIPEDATEASAFLTKNYGYDCPVLKSMHHARAMRAVAAMVHEGFNPATSAIGMKAKLAVAQIFSMITESVIAQEATTAIAKHFEVDQQTQDFASALAGESNPIAAAQRLFPAEEYSQLRALLVVAHAISWSPARVSKAVIQLCKDAKVPSPALVEVVAVVSVLQMLHRISMFYRFDK